jgi:plastocyanin
MRQLCLVALLAGAFALAVGLTTTTAQPPAGDWATITGQVTFTKAPKPAEVNVTVDKQHCLSKGPLVYEEVIVDPKSKGLKNVVVWLRPDVPDRRAPFPADKINPKLAKAAAKNHVIDQPCCQFVPRIVAAREGDTLEVKNSSPVAHNTNMTADNPAFTYNITLPPGKSYKPAATLAAQSSPIPFKCDIHPWMAGRLRVFDHPYYAVTDADGKFEIKDAPAGKWRMVVWHESGYHKGREGALGLPVDVKGPTTAVPVIDFEPPAASK